MKRQIKDHILVENDPDIEDAKYYLREYVPLAFFLALFAITSPTFYKLGKVIYGRVHNEHFVAPQLIEELAAEKRSLKADGKIVSEFNYALDITINDLIRDKVFDRDLALKIKTICRLSFMPPGELIFFLYGVNNYKIDWSILAKDNPELKKELPTIYEITTRIGFISEDLLFKIYSNYGLRKDLLSPETYKKLRKTEDSRMRIYNDFGIYRLGGILSRNDQIQRENRQYSERMKMQNRRAQNFNAKALKLRTARPRV